MTKVLKFGGTSVGSPERMFAVRELVTRDQDTKIVVLSAVAGTTNSLVEISEALYAKEHDRAGYLISKLEKQYEDMLNELYSSKEFIEKGVELIKAHFEFIRSFTKDMFTLFEERAVLAQGELMSTALFHFHLQEKGIDSVLLPALDFMRIDENGEPDLPYIEKNLNKLLENHKSDNLFITQGYICRNPFGEIANLKRGGSDYTASLIGAAINADEIQIWTDIDGMHNNDPRFVEGTHPIAELSFEEAAELAYFGAKILHPSSIQPARMKNIPVRLLNTMAPEKKGTLITADSTRDQVKAVAAKDGIIAIKIKSTRMLLAYGFLRHIFEVFERYKTSIDMITTSEVAVSVTIDDKTNLDKIVAELNEYGKVEVEENQTIICLVGDFLGDKYGYAVKIFDALKTIPIRMISYGGSKNNVSMLVNSQHKKDALNALQRLFEKQEANV